MFAYFCDSITQIEAFILAPLAMFIHFCFGGADWKTRRDRSHGDVVKVIANITPPLSWICLTICIMLFWGKVFEGYFFFDDHKKVANGMLILSGITILPIIIWWMRNKGIITDVKNNLIIGKKYGTVYRIVSLLIFILHIVMPLAILSL